MPALRDRHQGWYDILRRRTARRLGLDLRSLPLTILNGLWGSFLDDQERWPPAISWVLFDDRLDLALEPVLVQHLRRQRQL